MIPAILFSFFLLVETTQVAVCDDIYFVNSNETSYKGDEVVCNGNVMIVYGERIISADKVIYNQKKEEVVASGNVALKDEQRNVYFFSFLKVHKNFKDGEGKDIKVIMHDCSRLAAESCILKDGKFDLKNAVYTPCYECVAFDALTWEAKSSRVQLDLEDTIDYEDLNIELLGKGIFYWPYLSIPSPKIKKKTGFLAPKFSISSKGGFSINPQYFINISEQQELILKPIITQKIGSVAWIYYGARFLNGEFSADASITGVKSAKEAKIHDDNRKIVDKIIKSGYRGHIFSEFKYEIDDVWRSEASINLASDRFYLRRFPFLSNVDRLLESRVTLEGFDDRNYTIVKALSFQTRDNDEVPRILPIIERNISFDLFDGTLNSDFIFVNSMFKHGRRAQKIAGNISWNKSFIISGGNIFEFKVLASIKALKVVEKEKSDYNSFFDTTPQISLIWKFPVLFSSDIISTVVTPIAGIIAGGNKKHIDVFEDQFSEINSMNFSEGEKSVSPNAIDYGSRFCYGTKLSFYKKGKTLGYFSIGRTTEITDVVKRAEATGLKYKNSNIVSGLDLFLTDEITFSASGSYSTETKKWLKFECGTRAIYKKLDADVMIFNGKQCSYNPFSFYENDINQEERYKGSSVNIGWKINEKVKLRGGLVFGTEQKTKHNTGYGYSSCRLIRHNIGMEYQNECASISTNLEQTRYRSGDIKPEMSFSFIITLKNFM